MRFEWHSSVRATSYRITLRDSKGVLIFSAMAARSPYLTHDGQRSQLKVGESYTWTVESLDAATAVIAESAPVTFRYKP